MRSLCKCNPYYPEVLSKIVFIQNVRDLYYVTLYEQFSNAIKQLTWLIGRDFTIQIRDSFLPTVLEAVLEAARQKMHGVSYLNRSPLIIGYGFYFYDSFNAPVFCLKYYKVLTELCL